MTDAVNYDAELDASGLTCPLPLLKAKLELNRLVSREGMEPAEFIEQHTLQ